jgi:hypothetical protein
MFSAHLVCWRDELLITIQSLARFVTTFLRLKQDSSPVRVSGKLLSVAAERDAGDGEHEKIARTASRSATNAWPDKPCVPLYSCLS